MEDTRTHSTQSFWNKRYGLFAISLASAFSVNSTAQGMTESLSVDSFVSIQAELNYTETLGTNKVYSFPAKKYLRERYRRIAQSEWFKKTHSGMSIGEVMTIEE